MVKVWVIGGCRGIGRAIADLHYERDDLVFVTHRGGSLCSMNAKWEVSLPYQILSGGLECLNSSSIHLEEVFENGCPNVIYFCHHQPIGEQMTQLGWGEFESQYQGVMRPIVNVLGLILQREESLDGLSIVCLSSITTRQRNVNQDLWARSTAKGAMETLVLNASATLAERGARVNALLVDWTQTDQVREYIAMGGKLPDNYLSYADLATPYEVAKKALYLGCNKAAHLNGKVIAIDDNQ